MVNGQELADAVIRAAEATGSTAATLSLTDIARAVGVSRSTLLRQYGSRADIDALLADHGVDRSRLADRLVTTTGMLISTEGLDAISLERIALEAECTVASIYAQIGGRDALLIRVFERHAVLPQLKPLLTDRTADLDDAIRTIYRELIDISFDDSSVSSALMIDALRRPSSDLAQHLRSTYLAQANRLVGTFLRRLVRDGTLRNLSTASLMALFFGPVQFYVQTAALTQQYPPPRTRARVATELADAFLRATRMTTENGP